MQHHIFRIALDALKILTLWQRKPDALGGHAQCDWAHQNGLHQCPRVVLRQLLDKLVRPFLLV